MSWISIVFMQDSQDYEPAEAIYNDEGFEGLFKYLLQWYESHKDSFNIIYNESPKGATDTTQRFDEFEVAINQKLGYCGLAKKIT